jgi:sugar transferase (PEP-CTERM system associated)
MIRLFHVYFPVRTLLLVVGEVLIIWTSFLIGTVLQYREDSFLVLNFEYGYYKILAATALALLCAHWADLYDPDQFPSKTELYFRLCIVLAAVCFLLAALSIFFPAFTPGHHAFLSGLVILSLALVGWRSVYLWLLQQPFLRERVYVVGGGGRAEQLVEAFRSRKDLGLDVVGWQEVQDGENGHESLLPILQPGDKKRRIDRIILAFPDRRGTMPVRELLNLRLQHLQIEDSTSWFEKISGKIELDDLFPSWIIFSDGFHFGPGLLLVRRLISVAASMLLLVLVLPVIPLVALAIKLTSPGPVLYRQKRVGRNGVVFNCCKFRTMRSDAEADSGPTWAGDDDPRITRIGKFLRRTRLDEIPQLWNVLCGDMGFVGPRPERPEFVEWLSREIPYYGIRHVIRPGVTGWAQIRYKYGNSVADAKEKLKYDLFYLKNISIGLDALIMFQTIKTVVLRRGAQ